MAFFAAADINGRRRTPEIHTEKYAHGNQPPSLPRICRRGFLIFVISSRETTKAVRGKRELWRVIQANARHACEVAAAVDARDLKEIKRIVERAKLTRRKFASVCDRLGFRTDGVAVAKENGKSDLHASPPMVSQAPPTPPTPPTSPTPSKTVGLGDVAIPVFFLDTEGSGGTTALGLATVENDAEMVRQFIEKVIIRHIFVQSITVRVV